MPIRARLLPLCAAVLAITAGCAAHRLLATAPAGLRLGGDWVLDPAASENTAQAVAHLQAEISNAMHLRPQRASGSAEAGARRRRMGAGPAAPRGDAGRTGPQPSAAARAQPAPGAALIQEFLSNIAGNNLAITVTAGSVTVASDDSSQQYAPGVQTAVEWGRIGAQQISGWQGRRYVIDTRPEWGPAITQSYGLAPDGMLVVTLRLEGSGIDATLTRRYRRTKHAPRALLPTNN